MIAARIPWQYRIAARQTVPILTGIVGCFALLVTLGYFYAREEILSITNAQVKQFVSSIMRQDDYTRQWIMRAMPTLTLAVERHLTQGTIQQDLMDSEITSAISDARGKQFIEILYLKDNKLHSRYYCQKGVLPAQVVDNIFAAPPAVEHIPLIKEAYWSDAYVDRERTLHISYTQPLKDNKNNTFGILTTSLAIPWFTERIRSLAFFKQCIPFYLTPQGDWTLSPKTDTDLEPLKNIMRSSKTGITTITWQNKRYVVLFMPSGESELLIGVLIPREDLFGTLDTTAQVLVLIAFVVLLLATCALHKTNENFRIPLHQLLRMADKLAKGKFDASEQTKLPSSFVTTSQETKQLYTATQKLRLALRQRMHDLTIMTQTKERLDGELRFARGIQNSLRPRTLPSCEEIEIAAFVHEAREVCGDMYDCFSLSEHEVCCVIGNVAEHGVPAALLTNRIMPLLHELILLGFTPSQALEHVNKVFDSDENTKALLVSAFVGILHVSTGLLTWASAGQFPPYILQNTASEKKHWQLPWSGNMPLGAKENEHYGEHQVQLEAGQSILFLPQRILFLPDPQKKVYGEKCLDVFLQQDHGNIQDLLHAFVEDIRVHMQRVLRDDMVLFAIQWKGNTSHKL